MNSGLVSRLAGFALGLDESVRLQLRVSCNESIPSLVLYRLIKSEFMHIEVVGNPY